MLNHPDIQEATGFHTDLVSADISVSTDTKEILINSPDSYISDLYKAKVIVDQNKRREDIIQLAENTAKAAGGKVRLNPSLVDEVTYLVEWPVPALGSFDKKYLVIPQAVIITVMASHQRYFPVFTKDGNELLNHYITMTNYVGDNLENINRGNERVIKARLRCYILLYRRHKKNS